jgi:hypothetical protein
MELLYQGPYKLVLKETAKIDFMPQSLSITSEKNGNKIVSVPDGMIEQDRNSFSFRSGNDMFSWSFRFIVRIYDANKNIIWDSTNIFHKDRP